MSGSELNNFPFINELEKLKYFLIKIKKYEQKGYCYFSVPLVKHKI